MLLINIVTVKSIIDLSFENKSGGFVCKFTYSNTHTHITPLFKSHILHHAFNSCKLWFITIRFFQWESSHGNIERHIFKFKVTKLGKVDRQI